MAEARKDDMKDIWDATELGFMVYSTHRVPGMSWNPDSGCVLVAKSGSNYGPSSCRYDWEAAWRRVKQLADMTEDEFEAEQQEDQRRRKEHFERETSDEEDGSHEDGDNNADEVKRGKVEEEEEGEEDVEGEEEDKEEQ